MGGKRAVEKEKKKTKMEGTQPESSRGYTRLEVFENIEMKADDHDHPKHFKMEIATPKSEEKA